MKRIFLALGLLGIVANFCFSTKAEAACAGTFGVMKDNASNTFNMGLANDINGNCNSYFTPLQGAALLSATNGWYTNLLQGNAVIASGNPLFSQLTAGSAIVGKFGIDQTTPGTTNGVQVNAGSAIIGKVGIDQTTPGTTNAVAVNTSTPEGTLADAPASIPTSTTNASIIALLKALINIGQYPAGATAITTSTTGTTAATTATLAGIASHTTYVCGLSIRANATAAATGNATVTGTITGTLNFTQWTAPLASGLGVTEQIFNPCVPASAQNTGIAIISAAPGTGGTVSVTGWGYQL